MNTRKWLFIKIPLVASTSSDYHRPYPRHPANNPLFGHAPDSPLWLESSLLYWKKRLPKIWDSWGLWREQSFDNFHTVDKSWAELKSFAIEGLAADFWSSVYMQ